MGCVSYQQKWDDSKSWRARYEKCHTTAVYELRVTEWILGDSHANSALIVSLCLCDAAFSKDPQVALEPAFPVEQRPRRVCTRRLLGALRAKPRVKETPLVAELIALIDADSDACPLWCRVQLPQDVRVSFSIPGLLARKHKGAVTRALPLVIHPEGMRAAHPW